MLGEGLTSKAVKDFIETHSGEVHVLADLNEDIALKQFDYIVTSPGIPFDHPIFKKIALEHKTYLSDIDLFCMVNQTPTIAVTGTNGKTTVTKMIQAGLESHDLNVRVGGNQEVSCLELLNHHCDVYVIELSSFQLFHSENLSFDIGLVTNLDTDHLSWHQTVEHYHQSKMKLKRFSKKFMFQEKSPLPVDEQNSSIAAKACDALGYSVSKTLLQQIKLPHRMEEFNLNGIKWINDSKATNVSATCSALATFTDYHRLFVILGGTLKGQDDFFRLKAYAGENVFFLAYGQAKNSICSEIDVLHEEDSLKSLMDWLMKKVQQGDTILLSPGCSSFDQFRDYTERGIFFKHYARQQSKIL
tara:strand:+ start:2503 stop:3576 length:1074 start_codon:yes stop_codon:yes gene_type:complete